MKVEEEVVEEVLEENPGASRVPPSRVQINKAQPEEREKGGRMPWGEMSRRKERTFFFFFFFHPLLLPLWCQRERERRKEEAVER